MGYLRAKRNMLEYELREVIHELREVIQQHVHAKEKYLEWCIKVSEEQDVT